MSESLTQFFRETVAPWWPAILSVAAVFGGLWLVNHWLRKRTPELGSEKKLPRQLLMLAMTCAGIVMIIMVLPVEPSTRNQLLTLLGLIASGTIGLSSTTLVSNAIAGMMLRTMNSIRTGDFLRVAGHFGRVTQRGLLHTEIQTENRDLTTLPNAFLISNPYTVVRSSGAIVSGTLSLGYDVSVSKVEPLLLDAVRQAGLTEPFVMVTELGNYAITYRVAGFLSDIKHLLSAHSELYKAVIHSLHGAGIEIVSPTFMNQRVLPHSLRVTPAANVVPIDSKTKPRPEEMMFDKAEEAKQIEEAKGKLQSELKSFEQQIELAKGDERKQIEESIQERKSQLEKLHQRFAAFNASGRFMQDRTTPPEELTDKNAPNSAE